MIYSLTFEANQYSPLRYTWFNFYCCFSKELFFAFILWDYCWVMNTELGSQLRLLYGNRMCTLDKNNVFVYNTDGVRFITFLTIHFLVLCFRFCKWCDRYFQGHRLMAVTVSLNKGPDSLQNPALSLGLSSGCCWARGKQVGRIHLLNRLCTVEIQHFHADAECFCGWSMHWTEKNCNEIKFKKKKTLEKVIFFDLFSMRFF